MPIFAFVSLWGFLKLVVPIYKRFELFERVLLCVLTETMYKAHKRWGRENSVYRKMNTTSNQSKIK